MSAIEYVGEDKIFNKEFSGVMPKIYLDYLKSPDKALLKKYLTTDRFSSNYGSSDSRNRLQGSTENLMKTFTNCDKSMMSEFTKDMKQFDIEFTKF